MPEQPEDTFEMERDTTTGKDLLTNATVPSNKNQRKIYGLCLQNQANAAVEMTLTIEEDATVVRTFKFWLDAYGQKDISRTLDAPLLTMQPGECIKSQVTSGTGPVTTILNAWDC